MNSPFSGSFWPFYELCTTPAVQRSSCSTGMLTATTKKSNYSLCHHPNRLVNNPGVYFLYLGANSDLQLCPEGRVGEANLQLLCKWECLNKSSALVNESLNPSSPFVILWVIHGCSCILRVRESPISINFWSISNISFCFHQFSSALQVLGWVPMFIFIFFVGKSLGGWSTWDGFCD